jgi:hypothetical protein
MNSGIKRRPPLPFWRRKARNSGGFLTPETEVTGLAPTGGAFARAVDRLRREGIGFQRTFPAQIPRFRSPPERDACAARVVRRRTRGQQTATRY